MRAISCQGVVKLVSQWFEMEALNLEQCQMHSQRNIFVRPQFPASAHHANRRSTPGAALSRGHGREAVTTARKGEGGEGREEGQPQNETPRGTGGRKATEGASRATLLRSSLLQHETRNYSAPLCHCNVRARDINEIINAEVC